MKRGDLIYDFLAFADVSVNVLYRFDRFKGNVKFFNIAYGDSVGIGKAGRYMEFKKLKQVIAEVLSVDPEEITMETTFVEDLGADSLDVFQIVLGIEEEFDIEISQEMAERISTVGEAVDLIKNSAK